LVKTQTSAEENPQPFEPIERIEPFEQVIAQKKAALLRQLFLKVIESKLIFNFNFTF